MHSGFKVTLASIHVHLYNYMFKILKSDTVQCEASLAWYDCICMLFMDNSLVSAEEKNHYTSSFVF